MILKTRKKSKYVFFVILILFTQLYFIHNVGLTSDEPGYNLNSFNEIKFLFGIETPELGLDVIHGNTFQILGSTLSCILNPQECLNIFNNLDNKELFWNSYDSYLIKVRYILIPLSIIGQFSILFAAQLFTKLKTFNFIPLLILNFYPIWVSHSSFNFSDFIPLVGFSMLILSFTSFYRIDEFKNDILVRLGLSPWFVFFSFLLISGSRFPLIYLGCLAFVISLIPNYKKYVTFYTLKNILMPFLFFLIIFSLTNIRFMSELPFSLLNSLRVSSNFNVDNNSQIFILSTYYSSSHPPIWYIPLSNFIRIPLLYLFLTLSGILYILKTGNRVKNFNIFILSLSTISIIPILYASFSQNPSYDTARHFYFTHSVILLLSVIFTILLLKYLSSNNFHLKLISFIFSFLFLILIVDEIKLNTKIYVYRNEISRLFGDNLIESDYWASNRNSFTKFFSNENYPILIKSQWYQNDTKLFFKNFKFVDNFSDAVDKSKLLNKLIIFRSAIPLEFTNFETSYPECIILYTSYSTLINQRITDGRIYKCIEKI